VRCTSELLPRQQESKDLTTNLHTEDGTYGQNCCGNNAKTNQNLTIDGTREMVPTTVREITDDSSQHNRVRKESSQMENHLRTQVNTKMLEFVNSFIQKK
jgi:hypothetical protein